MNEKITMNKNSYQIGSGSPLTEQEQLQESWQQIRDDAEMV